MAALPIGSHPLTPQIRTELHPESSLHIESSCARIKRVALPIIAGMALELGCKAVFLSILAVPLTNLFLPSYLVYFSISHLVTASLALYHEYYKDQSDIPKSSFLQTALKVSNLGLKLSCMRLFNVLGPGIAIHEAGHAALAWAFFKNAMPRIEIFPLEGGATTYQLSKLSKLGRLFGATKVELIIAAGGILSSLAFAMCEFALAQKCKDSHPTISHLLNLHALCQLLQEILYVIDTVFAELDDFGHDGLFLWKTGGIHPFILLASLITLPLTEINFLQSL